MTATEIAPAALETTHAPTTDPAFYRLVTTGDHKTVGRLYIVFSLIFLLVVLTMGVLVGFERADQGSIDLLGGVDTYFQAWTLWKFGLIVLAVVPLFVGLAIAIVPLQVGSPAIAFPRAAALSLWGWLVGGLIFSISIAVDGGLGAAPAGGVDPDAAALTILGLTLALISLVLASVCIATTVISLRPVGMYLHRVPLFAWSSLVASVLWLLVLPVAVANLVIAYVDFRNAAPLSFGNQVALQVSWMLRPPTVFAFVIPALGILGDIVPVAGKVRQNLYSVLLGAIALFGVLSFGAFVQVGNIEEQFVYIAMSFALLVPVLMYLGGIADTMRRGGKNIGLPPTGLLCALLGTLVIFAGASMAAIRAISAFDLAGTIPTTATDAAFDAALLGGLCAGLGGVAWWSSKLIGRSFSEMGRPLALLLGGGAFVAAVPELVSGFLDQPGGGFQASFDNVKDGVELSNLISAIGLCLVALGVLGFIGLLLKSFRGDAAAADPVDGHTLEWATASPPPAGNFAEAVAPVRSERPLLDIKEAQ
ncbi:MAG: cbb3-type cytochrome c oxidase subunit I [Acidimicrobiales bacterium]